MDMRQEIRRRISALASGELDPENVSDWALSAMEEDCSELMDPAVWKALDQMGGADLMVGPGEYMHGSEDFTAWLNEFLESLHG